MKIYERSSRIWVTILFLIISVCYLYVQNSIHYKTTALSIEQLVYFANESWKMLIFLSVVIFSIFYLKSFSKYLFVFYTLYQFSHSLFLLYLGMNKIILVMSFIHLVVSYYYYQIWCEELKKAAYTPNYSFLDYELRSVSNIEVELNSSEKIKGLLTNWDSNSCFIKLEQPYKFNNKKIEVNIFFKGIKFLCHGKIIASFNNFDGVGVLLYEVQEEQGWNSFYKILQLFGLLPQIVLPV